ncbi:MAG: sigma-54-dependent Fis family transcriptional regulator [Rhodospirillales bacterium]|nr:sigma-54-dependent Fis family transcriptional regulator [Rhodospirillales bacterium]
MSHSKNDHHESKDKRVHSYPIRGIKFQFPAKENHTKIAEIDELIASLRFSPTEGRIWFDNHPVALVRSSSLSSLHRELVEILGQLDAGHFLAKLGYASGERDAFVARKWYPESNLDDLFKFGPQLRSVRGIVSMSPVKQEIDLETEHFYNEAIFSGDFEADTLLTNDGMANTPVCWMQVGFAAGYATTLLGRPVIYKEVECRATGSRHCRIIGRLAEEWHEDEVVDEVQCFPDKILKGHSPTPTASRNLNLSDIPEVLDEPLPGGIIGSSPAIIQTCNIIRKVAPTTATTLFQGETGVGKDVLAKALHQLSNRWDKPLITLNCGAIPHNLIEAELFGVEKAAFTGATKSRVGRFERAHEGTLFLDEIGTLSTSAQIKLLRAIQEKEIERVGDTITRKVDVRIIAATNENLQQAVAEGRFREDLLYRINVFPINIPPLRERKEDIPLLMLHFLKRYNERHKKNVSGFTESAANAFYQYSFPGNHRELENLVERAVILVADHQPIDLIHLFGVEGLVPVRVGGAQDLEPELTDIDNEPLYGAILDEMTADGTPIKDIERQLILKAMDKAEGNLAQAARILGMTRPQLSYRLKKHQSKAGA